jgi:hypothetical protein
MWNFGFSRLLYFRYSPLTHLGIARCGTDAPRLVALRMQAPWTDMMRTDAPQMYALLIRASEID